MNKLLVAALGLLALVLFPAMAMAKAHGAGQSGGKGHDNSQTPSSSAYEHAGDKAQFQRDTHDLGKHQGAEMHGEQDKDKDKDKNQGDGQGAANEKNKQKTKENELEMEREKEKAKQEKTDADTLLEQVKKSKGEKAK